MQTVSEDFHHIAQQGIRPHDWGLRMSFDKQFDPDVGFFTFDVSLFDGNDLLAPSDDNPLQEWDKYLYRDYSDRIVDMEWSREIDFPYSVQSALADYTLNNYDGYFTPGKGSPIDGYILPKRPVRMLAGFRGSSVLPQFVGMTQEMPVLDNATKTIAFHAMDFLSEMFAMPISQTVAMANVTTDEVLSSLFQQFGLTPSQYSLAKGRNKIPFLFFEKGKNAGDAFRELLQAEGGALWIDEQGIIRFEQRLPPVSDPVMLFNDSNVESISTSGDSQIINTVRIISDVREAQDFQLVYASTNPETGTSSFIEPIVIPANGSKFVPVDLEDPLLSVSTPLAGQTTGDSWFTVVDGDGDPVLDVAITLDTLNNNNYVMLFENSNAFPVTIDQLEVWGEPAKIVDQISYQAFDEDSVAAYGEQVLDIQNNLFGSESSCESFALSLISVYKTPNAIIEMSVKGDPSLQLGDTIEVDTRDVQGNYKIIKVANVMRDSRAQMTISAQKQLPLVFFTFDVSLFDGGDLLAP